MKKVSLLKTLAIFGAAAIAIAFNADCAQAGQWVLDDIVASAEYKAKNSYYSAWQGHYDYDTEEFKWKKETFSCKGNVLPPNFRDPNKGWGVSREMGGFSLYVKRKYGAYNTGGPHPAAVTKVNFSVVPKFVYVPSRINHSAANNWKGVPDPNDKPGTFYYFEKGRLTSTRVKGENFYDPNTAVKNITTLSAFQSPLPGSSLKVIEATDIQNQISDVREATKITKKTPEHGASVMWGDKRTFLVNVNSSAVSFNDLYAQVNIDLAASYQVEMLSFQLLSRRKQDELSSFNSTSTIVAGGVNDNIHKADVMVMVKRAERDINNANKSVPDFPSSLMPELKMGNVRIMNDMPPKVNKLGGMTDENGRMIIGLVTSGDYANHENEVPHVLFEGLSGTALGDAPTTDINHSWGIATLGMGDDFTEPWETEFDTIMGDYKRKIWAKVLFSSSPELPLDQHKMEFVPTYLRVREEDKITQKITTKIFSTDPADKKNARDTLYTIEDDITDSVKEYMVMGATTPVGNGLYKGEMTIKKDPELIANHFIVDHYDVKLRDRQVWKKK